MVRFAETPLRRNACSVSWSTVLVNEACCAAVGVPPKRAATCGLVNQAWGLPVAIALASGYGPAPKLMKPSATPAEGWVDGAIAALVADPRVWAMAELP